MIYLANGGVAFKIETPYVEEQHQPEESAQDYVRRNAREKALDIFKRCEPHYVSQRTIDSYYRR